MLEYLNCKSWWFARAKVEARNQRAFGHSRFRGFQKAEDGYDTIASLILAIGVII
jgi:hypothetical protein